MPDLHRETMTGFDAAVVKMNQEILKYVPQKGVEGCVTCVISMDDKNEVQAVCGILSSTCDEESENNVLHAAKHQLTLIEDAIVALKQKALEIYTTVVQIKKAEASAGTPEVGH